MKAIEWTEAHRREARVRRHEIAALAERDGRSLSTAFAGSWSEGAFRGFLQVIAGFDAARIEREVRRVDALATGRLVREHGWRPIHVFGDLGDFYTSEDEARDDACENGDDNDPRIVRVTRIRRAS